ncbi:glycerol 3-phosphate dehydrogenase (NAD(P)+) [Geoalkalibacter ferrihydriticus]|uniref:Glycerol-3-phosphate dehydrogenase [NAD(P)+] n=2 Tax=Geoalkalibacter ferrihydriticus TaxID=392333 RepID=A0A0C2HS70_9BACT|nr:NAD(P)H-dependent glycerol-3-phosphate dehydrogenase [Geoalkalibacter ferrihydriticus]KIH77655.1 glycerol-3-phosphate dehydrogenase [Geoalkalibacter ferrihydriticus DSM 17813]SDL72282.1 glycerol 3-phosphate dehydrogenase (NAD(P)+) [Geoalkalibacter ferrihydriticus]
MKIGVIGAGSWGTTLADLLARKGYAVTLWAYEADLVARMTQNRENDLFLPKVELAANLSFSADLAQTVTGKDLLLLVPPSQVMHALMLQAGPHISPGTLVVSASKGIETETLRTMSEVLEETLPRALHSRLTFLSGPSFAKEVAAGMPTAVVVAGRDLETARLVQEVVSTDTFRTYTNTDIMGVELGGALKNVIALAAGVSDGLGFGYNSRAALITRGLAEMTRLGLAKGAQAATFAGLAGMGDLVLTCTGDLSRNRSVGIELGRGRKLKEILSGMKMVAEGVKTSLATYRLAQKLGVEVPITEQMYLILYEDKDPRQAVIDLMARDLKAENV